MKENILITGSHGYLGSVLTPYLRKKGYNVFTVDTGFFYDSLINSKSSENINKFVRKDVRDIQFEDLQGIDVLIHLAGISNDPMNKMNTNLVYDPTREYSKKLAIMCKELGIRFIFASSCSVYGIGSDLLLDEDSNVNPQTGYSLNKYQIEKDLENLADKEFSPIALRFATVFGPSPRLRLDIVINMLTAMAFVNKNITLNSDGKSWRPNLHINDLCKSIYLTIRTNINNGKLTVLNVGQEANNMRIIDIAQIIQKIIPDTKLSFLQKDPELDKHGLIRDRKISGKDNRTYKVNFSRIEKILPGFKCDFSIHDGVLDLVNWYKKVKINETHINSKNFYRLQHLETLLNKSFLSDDLRWLIKK